MRIARAYYDAITCIEAQANLVEMNIGDYPNMKKEFRDKFSNRLHKMAYPETLKKPMDFEDFAAKLGMTNGK